MPLFISSALEKCVGTLRRPKDYNNYLFHWAQIDFGLPLPACWLKIGLDYVRRVATS